MSGLTPGWLKRSLDMAAQEVADREAAERKISKKYANCGETCNPNWLNISIQMAEDEVAARPPELRPIKGMHFVNNAVS